MYLKKLQKLGTLHGLPWEAFEKPLIHLCQLTDLACRLQAAVPGPVATAAKTFTPGVGAPWLPVVT